MPAGRPTVITDAVIAKAESYIRDWRANATEAVPTIEGLALHLGVARSTLYESEELSDILESIKVAQALMLVNGGLRSTFNSTITKLMLSKHGYIEQTATDHTTKGKELPTPILGGLSDVSSNNSDQEDSELTETD